MQPVQSLHDRDEIARFLSQESERRATTVCAALCQELLKTVEHIGLNVKADNRAAIAVYERLRFERIEVYEDFFCELAR